MPSKPVEGGSTPQAVRRPSTSESARVSAVPAGSGPGAVSARPRILLVEDDFVLRQSLAELLTLEGYYVSSAADGAEALWRLEREALPSAIVLDINLPRMDGISFREVQLQSSTFRTIPTIVLTATKNTRESLEALGFAALMSKPLVFNRLAEVLVNCCQAAA
jgi:CheY-like chemotaxis protein